MEPMTAFNEKSMRSMGAIAQVVLFNVFVLRKRPDLKLEPITIFLFPFYRTLLMFFRIFALMRNAIEYSIRKKKNSIR